MKPFLTIVAAMVVITVAAPYTQDQFGFSVADMMSGSAVRLD